MATAAGAAALLYYTLNRKLQSGATAHDDDENGSDEATNVPLGNDRVSHRLTQSPGTWLETTSTLSETLRFTYSETLWKWLIVDDGSSSSHEETKVGIFLTPRSLYSKLRLSQTTISDHFMPVYRRQIERLLKEFETEESDDSDRAQEVLL